MRGSFNVSRQIEQVSRLSSLSTGTESGGEAIAVYLRTLRGNDGKSQKRTSRDSLPRDRLKWIHEKDISKWR